MQKFNEPGFYEANQDGYSIFLYHIADDTPLLPNQQAGKYGINDNVDFMSIVIPGIKWKKIPASGKAFDGIGQFLIKKLFERR